MDSKGEANPNLSQYFTTVNNAPSYFDELCDSTANLKLDETASVPMEASPPPAAPPAAAPPAAAAGSSTSTNTLGTHLMEDNFIGAFKFTDYLQNAHEIDEDSKVPEDVRNYWDGYNAKPHERTLPGLKIDHDLVDPIAEAALKHLPECDVKQRKITTADDVTQDERGLRQLIANGCFRSAINLTGRLLTIYGQGFGKAGQPAKHSKHSLQLWFTRLALLGQIGELDLLRDESEAFGQLDRADVFYEFYPEMYGDKEGSIASFPFRMLLAELPAYFGNPEMALNNLSNLFLTTSAMNTHQDYAGYAEASDLWVRREIRVLHSMANCGIIMKKYKMIDDILFKVMAQYNSSLRREERRVLYSAWGRIYLQIGDIFGAEQKFALARRLRDSKSPPDMRDLVDKGLITVAKNDFPEAFAIFQKALQLDSGNTMILNNMGVSLLYAGKLKEAINLFERAIHLNPQKALHESLLVNLSTLYELESNNSKLKKLNLLRLINKYKPDLSVSLEICLKLQSI